MIRLTKQSDKNSPQEYDKLFEREPDWQDYRRWKYLLKYFRGGNLVDLGCLNSRIPGLIKDFWNTSYLGLDQAPEAIGKMNKQYSWAMARFVVGSVYNTKLKDNSFDYTILGEVLEHLEEPQKAVEEAFRILKPNRILAISVPLEEAIEPGAVDKERHIWSYTKQDIKNLVKPYAQKTKTKVLRSKWFPKYKYCWPQLLCFAWKK